MTLAPVTGAKKQTEEMILKLLYFTLLTLLLTGSAGAKNLSPIMPLEKVKAKGLPFLSQALLDLDAESVSLNHKQAKKSERLVRKLEKQIAKGFNISISLQLLAIYHKLQKHYLQRLHAENIGVEKEQLFAQKLNISRKSIQRLVNKTLPAVRDKKTAAVLLFHKHLARYFLTTEAHTRDKIVQEIQNDSRRDLPASLKRKITFLVNLHLKPNIKRLRRYQLQNNDYLAVVAYLREASMTHSEQRFARVLHRAAKRTAGMHKREKEIFLTYSVKLWRQATTKRNNWNTPPFDLQPFSELNAILPIVERSALSDWHQGKKERAVLLYRKLARDAKTKKYHPQLYRRYLELAKTRYTEARNSKYYDDALQQARKDYEQDKQAGNTTPIGGITLKALRTRHYNFILHELQQAKTSKYNSARKRQTISLAKKLSVTYPKTRVKLLEEVALVYYVLPDFARSASVYLHLSNTTNKEMHYLRKAIHAQSLYLRYPAVPQFTTSLTIAAKDIADYTQLTRMYARLDSLQSKIDWHSKSHYGILLRAAGDEARAVALWLKAVRQESKHDYAKQASAYMLTWLGKQQEWGKLEVLAKLLMRRKHSVPVSTPLHVFLEKALLNQGINAEKQGKHTLAIAKLREYKRRKDAPQLAFVTYRLTRLYKKTKQYKNFYFMLIDYVKNFPAGTHFRRALLEGALYAKLVAEEEHAIFFYRTFLAKYPNSKQEPSIRLKLISLYQAKGNAYGAIKELDFLFQNSTNSKHKLNLAQNIIALEFAHGKPAHALAKINWILANADAADKERGEAYYQKTALTIGKRKFTSLTVEEKHTLSGLEKEILAAKQKANFQQPYNDALALIALAQATTQVVYKVTREQIIRSTNIHEILQQASNSFTVGRKRYQRICQLNHKTLCVQSLYRLARYAEAYLQVIEKIAIADNLEDKITVPFNQKKQVMLDNIRGTIIQAHKKSLLIVKQGLAKPIVADQVTWIEKNDLDFQEMRNSTYFQFQTKEGQ